MLNEGIKILIALLLAIAISQLTKILIAKIKYKEVFDWKDLFLTGGMPSAHSSLVASLCLSIYLLEGFTIIFIMSLALTFIVIRDALGVRRSVGEEGKAINDIIKELNEIMKGKKVKLKEVNYSLGHEPKDVLAGILIGAISALIVLII